MNSFLKKRGLNRMDLCYLAALTLIGQIGRAHV